MEMRPINYTKGSRKLKTRVKHVAVKKADHPNMDDLRQLIGRQHLFVHKKTGEHFKIQNGRVYRILINHIW